MKLGDYIDTKQLEKHIEDGLISCRYHPRFPLAILNYTQEAMGHTHGDDTLRRCRGLIYDMGTMDVLARPMEAFFNINDTRYPETMVENLPTDCEVEVSEKMDGSMGIIYQYQDNPPEVATRGSFESEQAKWATAQLRSCHNAWKGWTPIVEIIYPENQIVVDYNGRTDLVLLAVINNETGEELNYEELSQWRYWHSPGLSLVPVYDKTPAQCVSENVRNREGYVAKFTNIHGVDRVKIKFEDYRLAHKAMFGMNTRDIWELARTGGNIPAASFALCSQEFRAWFTGKYQEFLHKFQDRKERVLDLIRQVRMREGYRLESLYDPRIEYDCKWTRKSSAEFFKAKAGDVIGACFAALDGKDYEAVIWKTLRPVRAESCRGGREDAQ